MKITDKRHVLKRIDRAITKVQEEISAHAKNGGLYSRGLASEGFAGGYLQALFDVEAALRHGQVSGRTHYWED